MFRKIVIALWICLAGIHTLKAQEYEVSISSEKDTALIGQQFRFSIEVRSNIPLNSVVPLDDKLFPPAIEIIDLASDSGNLNNVWSYTSHYLITGFDSGNYKTNPIPILISTHSQLDTLFTGSETFILVSPAVDTTAAIMDLKDPINTPFMLKELLPFTPYIAGIIVLAGLIYLWFFYFRNKKLAEAEFLPSLPPHVRALEALDRIKNQKLWQKGEVKEYYSQLSDTVRTYMEERFEIPAMESVTSDILRDFKTHSWEDESLLEILESLLQLSDLVKFAKEDPLPSDNEMNLNNAYIFVEKTKPLTSALEMAGKNL